eukprot:TRINITY_DN1275_c0_g1_i1.p1 TRINITY_DN1275_c0_g1~~TRINITY_DN1275_c0_g1_i1.p1  ORF type:complete len:202 (+),score=36.24 TRINITY_DN1275_c0_g1_i1:47-607(+)
MTSDYFNVTISGFIDVCEIPGEDELFCRYDFHAGNEWKLLDEGFKGGLSQLSHSSINNKNKQIHVWNLPLDASFNSSNIAGWPQIVIAVYGRDWLGRDRIRGYGSLHLPSSPGSHVKEIPLYRPINSSMSSSIRSFFSGQYPEFADPHQPAIPDGHSVVRTESIGNVSITLHVILRNFEECGYENT